VAGRTEAGGGTLLRMRVERPQDMAAMPAGLGRPFVIHAPDELRAAVRALGETLIRSSAAGPGR
jgi:hypothetical protein